MSLMDTVEVIFDDTDGRMELGSGRMEVIADLREIEE